MKVHLSQIPTQGMRRSLALPVAALTRLAREVEAGVSRVEAEVELKHLYETVEVSGTIRADLTLPCTLCLEPTRLALDEPFRVIQAPARLMAQLQQEVHLDEADLDLNFFEGEEIDLDELVEEQVLLMIPEIVHCREACQGLCPNCGANLNAEACRCQPDDADHPFAAMKELLTDPR